jgi:hypothetical protein
MSTIASLMSPSKSKMIDDGDGDDAAADDDDDAAVRTAVRRSLVRTTVLMSINTVMSPEHRSRLLTKEFYPLQVLLLLVD